MKTDLSDERENELDRTYNVGVAAGLDQAAERIMEVAVGDFKKGNDDSAEAFRALSSIIKQQAKEAHPGPPPKKETT
jgi:hypothetical protein